MNMNNYNLWSFRGCIQALKEGRAKIGRIEFGIMKYISARHNYYGIRIGHLYNAVYGIEIWIGKKTPYIGWNVGQA